MSTFPTVDESRGRLRRAGWSVGDVAQGLLWHVTGTNGENAVSASAPTQAGAWWAACVQAREVGMLGGGGAMTEEEWRECGDPTPMLEAISAGTGCPALLPCVCSLTACVTRAGLCPLYRRLRLFCCACARRVLPALPDPTCLLAVEAAESYVEGRIAERDAREAASEFDRRRREQFGTAAMRHHAPWLAVYAASHRRWEAYMDVLVPRSHIDLALAAVRETVEAQGSGEAGVLAALLRDLFEPAARPRGIAQAWLTTDAASLANAAYDERILPSGELEPERLAILSDALEEAGCDDEDILSHLRGPGPHVRGCWLRFVDCQHPP